MGNENMGAQKRDPQAGIFETGQGEAVAESQETTEPAAEAPVEERLLAGLEGMRTGKGTMTGSELLASVSAQDAPAQEALAREFFDTTIGRSLSNVRSAYEVYLRMKGTRFADAFNQLESDRLERAGFSRLQI